jgi:hypothetical protein
MRTFLINIHNIQILDTNNWKVIAEVPIQEKWKDIVINILFANKTGKLIRDALAVQAHNMDAVRDSAISLEKEMTNYKNNLLPRGIEDGVKEFIELSELLKDREV